MQVRINVTAKDIARGCRRDGTACPVFFACDRRLKGMIVVGDWVCMKGFSVATPGRVDEFIDAFDSGKPVKPFSFTIDVPAKFVKPKRKAKV